LIAHTDEYQYPAPSKEYWEKTKNEKRGYCYMCGEFACNPFSHKSKPDEQFEQRVAMLENIITEATTVPYRFKSSGNPASVYNVQQEIECSKNDVTGVYENEMQDSSPTPRRSRFLQKVQRKALVGETVKPSESFQSRFIRNK